MKRLVFHIALSVALFCVLTVIFVGHSEKDVPVYQVDKFDVSSIGFIEGEGYQCVGAPIGIVEKPEAVRAGDSVFLTFKGESYTEYSIRVYYPSGLSKAEVFSPRKSDGEGVFGWDFSVSENTRAGKLRIAVLSDNSYLLTEIEIIG